MHSFPAWWHILGRIFVSADQVWILRIFHGSKEFQFNYWLMSISLSLYWAWNATLYVVQLVDWGRDCLVMQVGFLRTWIFCSRVSWLSFFWNMHSIIICFEIEHLDPTLPCQAGNLTCQGEVSFGSNFRYYVGNRLVVNFAALFFFWFSCSLMFF